MKLCTKREYSGSPLNWWIEVDDVEELKELHRLFKCKYQVNWSAAEEYLKDKSYESGWFSFSCDPDYGIKRWFGKTVFAAMFYSDIEAGVVLSAKKVSRLINSYARWLDGVD